VLVLTPLKDGRRFLRRYVRNLRALRHPHERLSLGFLESDSRDCTYAAIRWWLPRLAREFARAEVWKHDYGYRVPRGVHRGHASIQLERRAVLARSRNLLLRQALRDEDWVLWLDVDVVEYPADVLERLLATGKEIVQPHCVLEPGGPTFDRNAWRDRGAVHMDQLRGEGELVELHAVGGTMLLVRADLHRRGLHFPEEPYGRGNPLARPGPGELETEGLGLMAHDLGVRCWGMPRLEIRHARH
jgi:hypothetical protein